MNSKAHRYALDLTWEGNLGTGTTQYQSYGRNFRVRSEGKPDLLGSADPHFRGDAALHNPETMLVAALSSCHMLSFLALCTREHINVVAYRDHATGTMEVDADGAGRFTEVTLHPEVTLADATHVDAMARLHRRSHELCFIANSVSFTVSHEETTVVREGP